MTLNQHFAVSVRCVSPYFIQLILSNTIVLIANVPRSFVNEDTCFLSTEPSACYDEYFPGYEGGVVVCGSPGEVANDASKRHQFDVRSDESITALSGDVANNQKNLIWSEIALTSE